MKKTLIKMYKGISRIKNVYYEKKKNKGIIEANSYFPEKKLKSNHEIEADNVKWVKKYGYANEFYRLYGLDVEGANQDVYLENMSFIRDRETMNKLGKYDSQTALLRDKFLFYKFMSCNKMPVPEVFAIVKNGRLFDVYFNEISWDNIAQEKDYFIKDISGECASFVKHISDYNHLMSIKDQLEGVIIFQRRIFQNDIMSSLNPEAINTLRLVSVYNNGNPYILAGLLRIGTHNTDCVDNWAAGGIAVGIEKDGHLKKYGFFKPTFGGKVSAHPDTGIVFSEFTVPFLEKAKKIACDAHKLFYNIETIGWDIAMTDDGPFFIEGNDNWEISLMQACDRPLRKEWESIVKEYKG